MPHPTWRYVEAVAGTVGLTVEYPNRSTVEVVAPDGRRFGEGVHIRVLHYPGEQRITAAEALSFVNAVVKEPLEDCPADCDCRECETCLGYGHFDENDKPTIDKRCRKCLDCNGTGRP